MTIPIRDGITEGGLIILGVLGAVMVALAVVGLVIWRFGSAIAKRIEAVQDQVANDHKKPDGTPILMRDDLDAKHDENAKKLDRTLTLITTVQRDVAFIMRRLLEQDDRLDVLEDTETRSQRDPTPHPHT